MRAHSEQSPRNSVCKTFLAEGLPSQQQTASRAIALAFLFPDMPVAAPKPCRQQGCGVLVRDGVTVIHLPTQRYLVVMPRERAQAPDDAGAWMALDIAAGIPFIMLATQEEFVPQMVNLDLIGGLSYTKGCYPGQEIVARTHYLGRLKQRMYRARVDGSAAAGDKLYCADLGDQASGMIVAGAPAADGRHDVLAVLQTANARTAQYHLGSLQGPPLELAALPYVAA